MASHPGPAGPGAANKIPPPRDEDLRSTAGGLSMRGPRPKAPPGTGGDVSGTRAGTATGRAVRQLLQPAPGAFRQEERIGKEGEPTGRFRTVLSQAERIRQQQVRSLRAGGPRGEGGFSGVGVNPRTGLTEAVGGTPTSGRTRGAVASGGTAGGRAGAGQPVFAGEGNFRSGVLGAGLFLDTTGLSAIDKLNPRG